MVIPLASYFGVSTDEILGLDAAKNEEKIQDYLDEYHRLGATGKAREKFELMIRAYNEFPNDWRIVEEYMWQLNYDPNCEGPFGNEVHKDELYRLCNRVLDECTLDKARYAALSILGGLYVIDGEVDKAMETTKRFPDYRMTSGEESEGLYERGTDEWWIGLRENIFVLADILQVKIRNAALYSNEQPSEQIEYLKKSVDLIKLIFDEEDYGFYNYDLSELFVWIANRYVRSGDLDSALEYYEKGFAHAKAYDALPKISTHSSFLVRGKVQDMTDTCSDSELNMIERLINDICSWDVYEKVKDLPEMQALLAKYEPFMGNKKDYSQM